MTIISISYALLVRFLPDSSELMCMIFQVLVMAELLLMVFLISLVMKDGSVSGLKVKCQLNTNAYPPGVKVSDQEMKTILFTPEIFHSEWNYSVAANS